MSTEDLAFQYLSDLAQLQPGDDNEEGGVETFGTLHFSVAYLKGRSTVEVNVMQAMDLPALKSDGTYVCCIGCLPVFIMYPVCKYLV